MSQCDIFELGERVCAARREKKISQNELARIAGIHRTSLIAFETGRAPEIAFATVLRLMNAVGLDLRPTTYNMGRPSLEDVMAESDEERENAPRMGR